MPKHNAKNINKTALHKKAMLKALTDTLGNATRACKIAGVSRSTYYGWIRETAEGYDPVFAASAADITEIAIDHVEDKLHELIDGVTIKKELKSGETRIYTVPPDTGAVCFYLKCKAKHRGYIERQELTGPGGKDLIPPAYNLSKLTTAELLNLKAMQNKMALEKNE